MTASNRPAVPSRPSALNALIWPSQKAMKSMPTPPSVAFCDSIYFTRSAAENRLKSVPSPLASISSYFDMSFNNPFKIVVSLIPEKSGFTCFRLTYTPVDIFLTSLLWVRRMDTGNLPSRRSFFSLISIENVGIRFEFWTNNGQTKLHIFTEMCVKVCKIRRV